MNPRAAKILGSIGANIPRELLRGGIKTTKEENFEREIVEKMLRDPRASVADKEKLRKALRIIDDPRYAAISIGKGVTRDVDPRVEKEIQRFVDARVKREIRAGRLPDPAKDRDGAKFREYVRSKFRKK